MDDKRYSTHLLCSSVTKQTIDLSFTPEAQKRIKFFDLAVGIVVRGEKDIVAVHAFIQINDLYPGKVRIQIAMDETD